MPIREWQIWNEPNLTRYWTRAAVREAVRAAAARLAPRPARGRPGLAHDPRRAAERELDRAAQDLQGGRARGVRRRRAAPLHRPAAQRDQADRVRPARDAPLPRRAQARVADRALLARLEGQDRRRAGVRDDRARPGVAAEARAVAAGEVAQAAQDPAGDLVHVALARGLAQLVRLVGAAAPARRPARQRPARSPCSGAPRGDSLAEQRVDARAPCDPR